jgi:peptidyl-dipeptidase A
VNYRLTTQVLTIVSSLLILGACQENKATGQAQAHTLNAKDAEVFLADAEKNLTDVSEYMGHAAWIAANFINEDSQYLETRANTEATLLSVKYAKKAETFDSVEVDPVTRRKLDSLKLGLVFPAPDDPEQAGKLAEIGSKMQAIYGRGEYCNKERCYTLGDMEAILSSSHDPEFLKEVWAGWRTISPPMRELYQKQVEIANAGAQDLGFDNLSVLWRSQYDMSPDDFAADMDKQWTTVKPLYESLHCHVRAKLNEFYGDEVLAKNGKIPAHLLGNMWAQQWGNIYDLVKPEMSSSSYDLTKLIEKSGMSEIDMVKTGEAFFTSLGFDPLPETFWQRSLFVKPQDRDVVCHASAWDIDNLDDLRIKMCIVKNAEDFQTIHHELGHNFYQRAYKEQSIFFRNSANDGFHEAVGDTIALSVTPSYLVEIGLLDKEPPEDEDLAILMNQALEKIAFLPFGLLVDKWRWQVFNGELGPQDYNKGWWDLREKYQGIEAPVARSEADFDPGAKYHIPGNTPYSRYFLAFVQQFQFHKSLCETAGYKGPLQRCSIYANKAAGEKLKLMLEMGASKPWPDAMEAMTGQRSLDASAIVDYFAPLKIWLDEQNQGRTCGW